MFPFRWGFQQHADCAAAIMGVQTSSRPWQQSSIRKHDQSTDGVVVGCIDDGTPLPVAFDKARIRQNIELR
jgi:hypothetical protein